jgi:transposase
VVADAKLYSEENAVNLKELGFITRIPGTLKRVTRVIGQALKRDTRCCLDETTRYQSIALCHCGLLTRCSRSRRVG